MPRTSQGGHARVRVYGRWLALGGPLLCALLGAVLPARVAAAEEPAKPKLSETQKQEVRDRYDKATRLYYLRKYSEAVAEYEAIYLLSADPVMLYNIAQCHRQNDEPEQAAQFYKNYLRNAPAATNRADVEKKITEMERLAEDRRKLPPASVPGAATPTAPPAGAAISPPPETATAPIGVLPPPPGAGTAQPPLAGSPPTVPDAVPPMGTAPVTGPTGAAAPTDLSATAPPPQSHVLRWSMLVGGGVLLTTGLVLGAAASGKAKDIEAAAKTRTRVFDTDLQKTETDGRAANGLAVAADVLGLVGLGTGIYLWMTEPPEPRVSRATVVPVAGPGFAGALARMTF